MKFFRKGVSKIKFLPAVADPAAPTRAEITAGVDVSPQVAAINGFQLSNAPIAVPNLADVFTPQINGEDTVADSSLTFNDDDADTDVREAVAKGTVGRMLLMPYGDVPTKRCETWEVVSTGVNDEWTTDNAPARFMAGFAVLSVPEQEAVIPALV
jgi:hypothetical protein